MLNGEMDFILNKNENRLVAAANLKKVNRGNIFCFDIIYLICNALLSIYEIYFQQSRAATIVSLVLLGGNVLPSVFTEMSFYKILGESKNKKDNKGLFALAKIIRVMAFLTVPIIFLVIVVCISKLWCFNIVMITATGIFFIVGGLDKTIDFYTDKAVGNMLQNKEG